MFSYNTTVHSSTQFTPHRLVFGEEARIPSEFESGEVSITYDEQLDNLLFKIFEAQSTARENIEQAKLRYKYYYDQKSKVADYEIGEYVYLQKEPRTSKLDDHYEEPYVTSGNSLVPYFKMIFRSKVALHNLGIRPNNEKRILCKTDYESKSVRKL